MNAFSHQSEQKYVLDNIEPVNELFFNTCFYNSLFPILRYFKRDIMGILINDIPYYCINKEGIIECKSHQIKSMENLISDINLKFDRCFIAEDPVSEIQTAIRQQRPLIIWIDCYYESVRSDMYRRMHWPHTLMVYGFDNEEKSVHILEHKSMDSPIYFKETMGYSDLHNSYQGYLTNFHQKNTATICSFYESGLNEYKIDAGNYRDIYLENINLCENSIRKGVEAIELYISRFHDIVCREDNLGPLVENLLKGVNQIINNKKVQMYILGRIFVEQESAVFALREILEQWNFIRFHLAKFAFTKIYKDKIMLEVSERFSRLYFLESEYHKNFGNKQGVNV